MNPGGVVLIALGGLALCQIFGGNALQRLRILSPDAGTVPKPPPESGPYGQLIGPDGKPTYPVGPPDAPNYQAPPLTPAAYPTLVG